MTPGIDGVRQLGEREIVSGTPVRIGKRSGFREELVTGDLR